MFPANYYQNVLVEIKFFITTSCEALSVAEHRGQREMAWDNLANKEGAGKKSFY